MNRLLITGGTGSLGSSLVKRCLSEHIFDQIVVFSRDELKQWEMQEQGLTDKRLRYFLGDIRDMDRLKRAFEGVTHVIHAAALKQLPRGEQEPNEFIKTNILGTSNVVNTALDFNINSIVFVSTDKAAAPVNLYGGTKLVAERLVGSMDSIKGNRKTRFNSVRYGNVWGSRGSVARLFKKLVSEGAKELPVTHPDMTRFNITLPAAMDLVLEVLLSDYSGRTIVPDLPAYTVKDLVKAFGCSIKNIGIRKGEKMHECMYTQEESYITHIYKGNYHIDFNHDLKPTPLSIVAEGVPYCSNNAELLKVPEIKELIKQL